jgi:hypothetical protein
VMSFIFYRKRFYVLYMMMLGQCFVFEEADNRPVASGIGTPDLQFP